MSQGGHQREASSFSPSLGVGVGADASGERSYFGNIGGFVGEGNSAIVRGDLHVPLDQTTLRDLMRQGTTLQDLPKLSSVDPNCSKAERLKEWRYSVDQKLGPLHPVLIEHWDWSWRSAEAIYQHWLTLGGELRAVLCVTAPVPVRYEWVERWSKDKLVAALPQRLQNEYR